MATFLTRRKARHHEIGPYRLKSGHLECIPVLFELLQGDQKLTDYGLPALGPSVKVLGRTSWVEFDRSDVVNLNHADRLDIEQELVLKFMYPGTRHSLRSGVNGKSDEFKNIPGWLIDQLGKWRDSAPYAPSLPRPLP